MRWMAWPGLALTTLAGLLTQPAPRQLLFEQAPAASSFAEARSWFGRSARRNVDAFNIVLGMYLVGHALPPGMAGRLAWASGRPEAGEVSPVLMVAAVLGSGRAGARDCAAQWWLQEFAAAGSESDGPASSRHRIPCAG